MGTHPAHEAPRLTAARPKPGASRIRPGFRGQKGYAEAGFCPLKAGGVPGQGPGASRSREAAPGPPWDVSGANRAFAGPSQGPRRVFAGFSPGGESGEGAGIGGSARIRTAKDLDDPARQRKKLWRLDAAASGNLGARSSRLPRSLTPGVLRRHETLAPGSPDVQKLWRPDSRPSRSLDTRAPGRQRNWTPGILQRQETWAPGKCAPPSRRRRPRMPRRITPRKCIAEIFPLCIFQRASDKPWDGPTAPTHTTALPRRAPPGSVPGGKGMASSGLAPKASPPDF